MDLLQVSQLLIAVAVGTSILLQARGTGLSSTFGGESTAYRSRRGIERTLFRDGISEGHEFLRFKTELRDPAKTALEFEEQWKLLGIGRLDAVLLGIGDDGHTASLFPGTPVLGVTDRIASEVFVPRLDQWRVTVTMPVIREATLRIVLAAGQSKRQILDEIRRGVDHPITRATTGLDTWWFTDRAATAELASDGSAEI